MLIKDSVYMHTATDKEGAAARGAGGHSENRRSVSDEVALLTRQLGTVACKAAFRKSTAAAGKECMPLQAILDGHA